MNLVSRFCGVPSKCENIICSSPKSKLVICCSFKKKERKKEKEIMTVLNAAATLEYEM